MIPLKILENKTISDVPGFQTIGIYSGVKRSGKNDLCVIYSKTPAVAAAVFTKNKIKAAPILLCMEHIKFENTQAIVINSGNANACTGSEGFEDAVTMAKTTAKELGLIPPHVLVSSTGIIGVPMPMNKITKGIQTACKNLEKNDGDSAAKAIMTTDTFTKKITVTINIEDKPIYISGIAKGSGMIHPNMGTMLSFITTNINIEKSLLQLALRNSVKDSYNMVSVDGDTSTNDMVVVMANGVAQNSLIDTTNDSYIKFKEALDFVNKELAKMIAKDGEGATKLIETHVINAKTIQDAKLCAKSVISSSLVKSALFGSDANWGRILCAIGYADGNFAPEKVDIFFKNHIGSIQVAQNGMGIPFDETTAKSILEQEYVNILIDLKDGEQSATAWGCDLTYDYVKINGCYRT
ncbi:bifunctional glutamate N-acetyltransferase/amino-acid acetyltransferase ArgJ [Crassaminicella profunda]|uniref:bifunctional glutamate N-acetyltransferase/amino-acid acetyltransferase ArgJ n=1 Tax=Crassaminicella profunda TaxID=1286698 RepID=UPI001CA6C7BA|nr:bifunctional glutamate N-acetyltransferase/amino-acid acetyltransferase ArgJ [Crassaminicella profunda]QZY54983.1 bifunctional glutamate N-acetyltransferase/amino-acid acetyltransferase ArgJ [Crassaminicella profunda]